MCASDSFPWLCLVFYITPHPVTILDSLSFPLLFQSVKTCGQKSRSLLNKSAITKGGGGSGRWGGGGLGGVYFHYFLLTKKMGGFCPLLYLKGLNACLLVENFKMERLASILQDLQPGMWMVSLDLKDTYLHVPISQAVPEVCVEEFLRSLPHIPMGCPSIQVGYAGSSPNSWLQW